MPFSDAEATVIGVLCLVNIALTLGVVRRLGEHGRLLAQRAVPPAEPGAIGISPGTRVGDFAVISADGRPVSRTDLTGPTLVGFMAPGCPACEFSLPSFITRAESVPGGRDNVLAVVMGSREGSREVCDRLAPVARIVTEEEEGGPLVRAFGVGGLPAFALLSGSTVVASHSLPERLPDTTSA
jgi:thiol-disulfide isomerase/thioredoxin